MSGPSFLAAIRVFLLQSRSVRRNRNTSVADRIGVEEEEEEEERDICSDGGRDEDG